MGQGSAGAAQSRSRLKIVLKRDLYDVGYLASVLQELGFAQDCAAWEAGCEGDGSKVPAMLGEAMLSVGNALIAMTAEEVGELLAKAGAVPPPEGAELPAGERKASAIWQRFRAGFAAADMDAPQEIGTLSRSIAACRTMLQEISAHLPPEKTRAAAEASAEDAGETPAEDKSDDDTAADTDDDTADDDKAEDAATRSDADYRRRQADLLSFPAAL